jgi:citronellol/citronellal dehydrogenase
MEAHELEGKVAIVTGGSRGIGKAIAVGLSRVGAKVVVCGRGTGSGPLTIETTAAEINDAGGEAMCVTCDVTNEADVANLVAQIVERWGTVDVLVNNAGLKWGRSFDDTSYERWVAMFLTNVHGVFLCSQAVLPHMRRQGSGSIVTISSRRAQSDDAGGAVYAASKAAADRLMIKLAAEMKGEGIAVNSLYPGSTATEESIASGKDAPGRKTAYETNVIPAVVFLAGQGGDGVTGLVLDQAKYGSEWP